MNVHGTCAATMAEQGKTLRCSFCNEMLDTCRACSFCVSTHRYVCTYTTIRDTLLEVWEALNECEPPVVHLPDEEKAKVTSTIAYIRHLTFEGTKLDIGHYIMLTRTFCDCKSYCRMSTLCSKNPETPYKWAPNNKCDPIELFPDSDDEG